MLNRDNKSGNFCAEPLTPEDVKVKTEVSTAGLLLVFQVIPRPGRVAGCN